MSTQYRIKLLGTKSKCNASFVQRPDGKWDGYVCAFNEKTAYLYSLNEAHEEAEIQRKWFGRAFEAFEQAIVEEV